MRQGLSTIGRESAGRERPATYPNAQRRVDDEIPHKLGLVRADETPWSCIGGAPSIVVAVAVVQSGGGWRQTWLGAALAELSWLVGHAARVCVGGMPLLSALSASCWLWLAAHVAQSCADYQLLPLLAGHAARVCVSTVPPVVVAIAVVAA